MSIHNRDHRNRKTTMNSTRARRHWLLAAVLGLAATVAAAGCDVNKLLQVDPVDRVPAEGLTTPANAVLLVNGAIADFECAYGAYAALSGVVAGELMDATQTAARWPADRRDFSQESYQDQYGTFGCTGLGVYIPLSTARWSAENILNALQGWTDQELADLTFDRQELIAKAAAYAGYTYVLMGEGFCSMAIDLSAEMTPAQILQLAADRFQTAITAAQAAGETAILNMARVGLARAYLDLGQGSDAVAAVQQVPQGFGFYMYPGTESSRRNNRIFAQNGEPPLGGTALSVGEEYQTYQHYGEADPRVLVSDYIRTNNDGTDLYFQHKYNTLSDSMRLASYDEAQLITAEVQGGQAAMDIIDAFHAAAGLAAPDWTGATEQDILDHVIEERRAMFWLEGYRLWDINRFNLPLVPAPGTTYRKGLAYSDYRCFPLPDIEIRNNPNLH